MVIVACLLLLKACNCDWTSNVVLLNVFNSTEVGVTSTPFIDKASVSNVPLISALPSISKDAASNSPVRVILLKPVISLLTSTITALLHVTVPSVIPWIWLISVADALTFVPLMLNPSVSIDPLTSTLPWMSKEVASISPLDLNVTPSLPPTSNTIWSLVSNLIRLSSSRPIAKPVFFILVIALWVGKIDTSTSPDVPPPFIPPPAVTEVISPASAVELNCCNWVWILKQTPSRKSNSVFVILLTSTLPEPLDIIALPAVKSLVAIVVAAPVIVSCLILLSWLSCVCTSNVVLLSVLSSVAVESTPRSPKVQTKLLSLLNVLIFTSVAVFFFCVPPSRTTKWSPLSRSFVIADAQSKQTFKVTLPVVPPPSNKSPAVTPVISPGAFALKAASCDWIPLVTPSRKLNSSLVINPVPILVALSLLVVLIVSCLILLSWLNWLWTSLVTVLSWFISVEVAKIPRFPKLQTKLLSLSNPLMLILPLVSFFWLPLPSTTAKKSPSPSEVDVVSSLRSSVTHAEAVPLVTVIPSQPATLVTVPEHEDVVNISAKSLPADTKPLVVEATFIPPVAEIFPVTVNCSTAVLEPIDTLPSSWKIISSPSLSIKWAIGCAPSCWTNNAGPVPLLTTESADVVDTTVWLNLAVNASNVVAVNAFTRESPPTDKLSVTVNPFLTLKSLLSAIIHEFTVPRKYIYI